MFLTRLKSYRLNKGYSLRELAGLSGVDHTTIDRLERGRDAQERTVHKLAKALGVEPAALYAGEQTQTKPITENLQTPTIKVKPARPTRATAKKQSVSVPAQSVGFWVFDEDDTFGPFAQLEAERLRGKLVRARVYAAANRKEANDKHTEFLREVARGREAW